MITFSYANSLGSGDRSASITVTQVAGATSVPNLSNLVNGDFGTDVTLPNENWAFVFDFGTRKYIRQLIIWATSSTGIVTRTSGSNDGVSWTRLGQFDETIQGDVSDGTKGNGCVHQPIIDNLWSWRYYKLERVSGSAVFFARDIEFYIGGAATGLPYCTARYDGAAGNRVSNGLMAWSTNKSIVAGNISRLADGSLAGGTGDVVVGTEVDTYIQWDFREKNVVDIFTFNGFYSSNNLHGTWQIWGSNDNWGSHTVVQTDFGTPGFGTGFSTTLTSPGLYKSYRLQNVGGTGCSSTQSMTEFQFRLAPIMDFVEDGGGPGTMRTAVVA